MRGVRCSQCGSDDNDMYCFECFSEGAQEEKDLKAKIEKLELALQKKTREFCHEVEQHQITRRKLAEMQQSKI
jgi:hypothetical protein